MATAEIAIVRRRATRARRRGFRSYRPSGDPPTGDVLRLRREVEINAKDDWTVHLGNASGDTVRRSGTHIEMRLADRSDELAAEGTGNPAEDWPFWAGRWVAEMVKPSLLLGLVESVTFRDPAAASPTPFSAVPIWDIPSPYTGVANEHIGLLDIVADPAHGHLTEILAHHREGTRSDVYRLVW